MHPRQSFHFFLITGTLKINIFLKICKYLPFIVKNTYKKENLKKKKFKHFIWAPEINKMVFDLDKGEKKIQFLFVRRLKKIKVL